MKTISLILLSILIALIPMNPLCAQWVRANEAFGSEVLSFAVSGTNLFAGTLGHGVFVTVNNGESWNSLGKALPNSNVRCLAVNGSNLFAGTIGGGVFLSIDDGKNWNSVNTGLTFPYISVLTISGSNIFAGTLGGGVFLSTDNGSNWKSASAGMPTGALVYNLLAVGTNLFAGTGGGIFLSNDNGTSWTAVNTGLPSNATINSLAAIGSRIFAGALDSVFVSTDNGGSWSSLNTGFSDFWYAFAVSPAAGGTNLFAGTLNNGIFLSTNNGSSWNAVNSGLTDTSVTSLIVNGTYLFAGVMAGNNDFEVWRRPLSEMTTGINDKEKEVPLQFTLSQNFPNPFNPSTTIRFEVPQQSRVRLTIFNILGQRVAELANEEVNAGYYEKIWNAHVAAGMYLYRIEAVSVSDPTKRFVDTKKMLLLK